MIAAPRIHYRGAFSGRLRGWLRAAAALCLFAAPLALEAAELKALDAPPPSAFELKDLSGRSHRLADYRGKVVLINFWATWCEPCREEMPSIAKLANALAGSPFAVLAVNVDEPEARIAKFLSAMPLDFPVLLDPGRALTKRWNVRILPASFVIDGDGRMRYAATGELDWSSAAVAERIRALLPTR